MSIRYEYEKVSVAAGHLYVVATPIGHLADLSPRAADTLRAVDLIAAEDTRHSAVLLRHYGIATPLVSLHEHNEAARTPELIERLRAGAALALIADAGTPLVSDPGYRLVRAARDAGLPVVPVPGPSALIAALSVAGLPTDRFAFEGFLPAGAGARRTRLQALRAEPRTLVCYESCHRIADTLADCVEIVGPGRAAVLARELTKLHETVRGGTLAELHAFVRDDPHQQRGEIVLLIAGAPEPATDAGAAQRVLDILRAELPLKQAVALAARITGVSRNALYRAALQDERGGDSSA